MRGTLGWLFDLYRQTTAWTDLARSTRYKREKIMMRVLDTAGHQMVAAINEAHVTAGRERRAATPASAQAFIDKHLTVLFVAGIAAIIAILVIVERLH